MRVEVVFLLTVKKTLSLYQNSLKLNKVKGGWKLVERSPIIKWKEMEESKLRSLKKVGKGIL